MHIHFTVLKNFLIVVPLVCMVFLWIFTHMVSFLFFFGAMYIYCALCVSMSVHISLFMSLYTYILSIII